LDSIIRVAGSKGLKLRGGGEVVTDYAREATVALALITVQWMTIGIIIAIVTLLVLVRWRG